MIVAGDRMFLLGQVGGVHPFHDAIDGLQVAGNGGLADSERSGDISLSASESMPQERYPKPAPTQQLL